MHTIATGKPMIAAGSKVNPALVKAASAGKPGDVTESSTRKSIWGSRRMARRAMAESRRAIACVVCARLDWIENRKRCFLWRAPEEMASESLDTREEQKQEPEETEGRASGRGFLNCTRNADVLCVGDAHVADKFLATANYLHKMPLIPPEELYASSVRHPSHPEMTWLLHSRRVPLISIDAPSSAVKPANPEDSSNSVLKHVTLESANGNSPEAAEHRCVGVGDIDATVWMCPQCVSCLCRPAKDMNMPPLALASGSWLGWEQASSAMVSREDEITQAETLPHLTSMSFVLPVQSCKA